MSLPGEDALIAALAHLLPAPAHTRLPIGDDAAAVELPGGDLLLVTTDLLMEDVHFRLAWGDLPALGWKALAQNLSDIAAMGGTPTHALIAIALPPCWGPEEPQALYRGLADLAREAQVDIIGGDTVRSSGPLTLTLTVFGRVRTREILTRAQAQPGDALFVTGTLGRAAAGLQVLEAGRPYPPTLSAAVTAQLRPTPRLAAGRAFGASGLGHALMDLSDGLATDLHRLCRASGVGAIVECADLPIDPVVHATCAWLAEGGVSADPWQLALQGGEDFELLLAAPPQATMALQAAAAPLPLVRIGTATEAPDLLLRDASHTTPLPWGFTHF